MNWSLLQIILLVINLNFFILSVFLFKNKNGNALSNKILASILILLVYVNTHFVFLYDRQFYLSFPQFIGSHTPFLYLIPPAILFFYKSVFNTEFTLRRIDWFHFAPFMGILVLYLPLYFSSTEYKLNFVLTAECYIPSEWLSGLFFIQFSMYMTAIFMNVRRIISKSGKLLNPNVLSCLICSRVLAVSFIAVFIVVVLANLNYIFFPIFTSFIYYFLIYQVLAHPEIFFTCKYVRMEILQKKYQTNELSGPLVESIYTLAHTYIKEKKIFLNVKITLPDLAFQLNVPAYQLSQAINRKSGLNFNDFINRFRIEHCREVLLDEKYQHFTMEAIGELSGFRSRQTLIKSFKKFYNLTPSEYIKCHKAAV